MSAARSDVAGMIPRLIALAPAGSLLRTATAVLFPSLAVLDDGWPAAGILLYLVEIVLSAVLLLVRTGAGEWLARRASLRGDAPDTDWFALRKARRLASAIIAVGLMGSPFLWVAALLDAPGRPWPELVDLLADRGQTMALCILASGVLDVLTMPARSPQWLQASVARQMNRTVLLHPVILFGFLLYGLTQSLQGMVALFVVGRLALDLNGLRPGTRERARQQWFQRGGSLH